MTREATLPRIVRRRSPLHGVGVFAAERIRKNARIIDYEGQEQFCDANNVCTTRKVALNVKPGYDNMTGIGSPASGFVRALGR